MFPNRFNRCGKAQSEAGGALRFLGEPFSFSGCEAIRAESPLSEQANVIAFHLSVNGRLDLGHVISLPNDEQKQSLVTMVPDHGRD